MFRRFVEKLGWASSHRPLRLLVDIRESSASRGFHALAALNLITDHLKDVQLYVLSTGDGDELSAIETFQADWGVPVAVLREGERISQRIDLVFSVVDDANALSNSPRIDRIGRRTLLGVMFSSIKPRRNVMVVDGHDTAAMARRLARLTDPSSLFLTLAAKPLSCAS